MKLFNKLLNRRFRGKGKPSILKLREALRERIRKVEKLYREGVISEAEYTRMRETLENLAY